MTLQQLLYFQSVAQSASFTKAAREWFVSQTAISRQIRQLEQELNVTLLERNTAHVRLTTAGRFFYEKTSEICSSLREAVEQTQKLDYEQHTHLTLGIPTIVEEHVVVEKLRAFHIACPQVAIRAVSGSRQELVSALVGGKIDLLIAQDFDLPDLKGLSYTLLSEEHFVWLLPESHPLAKEARIAPNALQNETLLLIQESPTGPTGEYVDLYYRRLGLESNRRLCTSKLSDFFMLVGAGVGIGIIPSSASTWMKPDLCCVEIDGLQWTVRVLAITRPENSNPNIQTFLQLETPKRKEEKTGQPETAAQQAKTNSNCRKKLCT